MVTLAINRYLSTIWSSDSRGCWTRKWYDDHDDDVDVDDDVDNDDGDDDMMTMRMITLTGYKRLRVSGFH